MQPIKKEDLITNQWILIYVNDKPMGEHAYTFAIVHLTKVTDKHVSGMAYNGLNRIVKDDTVYIEDMMDIVNRIPFGSEIKFFDQPEIEIFELTPQEILLTFPNIGSI